MTDRREARRHELTGRMHREESCVLPALEARSGWGRAGDPLFCRDEHAKIRSFLERFVAAAASLDSASSDDPRRAGRPIGARESFRTLLEHHDDCAKRCPYPHLVKVTTPAERAAILA